MAVFISELTAPATSISTKVPSSGLARRTLSEAVAIGCQYSLHAFGDMRRRQGRAGNVADVAVDFERAAAGLADEFGEPGRGPGFAAIGLPVLQNPAPVDGRLPALFPPVR